MILYPMMCYFVAALWCKALDGHKMPSRERSEQKRTVSLVAVCFAYVYYTQLECILTGPLGTKLAWKESATPVLLILKTQLTPHSASKGMWVLVASWVLYAWPVTQLNDLRTVLARSTAAVANFIFLRGLSTSIDESTAGISFGSFLGFCVIVLTFSNVVFIFNPVAALVAVVYDPYRKLLISVKKKGMEFKTFSRSIVNVVGILVVYYARVLPMGKCWLFCGPPTVAPPPPPPTNLENLAAMFMNWS